MPAAPSKWTDLKLRLGSGAVLVAGGLGLIAAGGDWFHAGVSIICGAMVWELAAMLTGAPRHPAIALGVASGAVLMLASYLPAAYVLPLLLAIGIVGSAAIERGKRIYILYSVAILLAGIGMILLRDDFGFVWMMWLVVIVVVTDVAGYFAGRLFGGPKFWPRISPKKTWSGTVAGWVAAGFAGFFFERYTGAGHEIIAVSISLSMASQMGDIAESAIKRRMEVKDSSHLIPGHGGVLDRFDGMLGASIFLLLIEQIVDFPPPVLP